MELGYKQEIGVGAFVIAGLVLFTVAMFWLTGRTIGAHGVIVDVVFTNVAGLKTGDPVLVSGVKKGRVANVRLERVGKVTVTLELNADVRPRIDASARVASSDFFGAKFIDYSPGSKDDPLPSSSVIIGTREEELTDVAAGVATRANELLGNATTLVSERLAEDIHNTLVATQRGMNALADVSGGPVVRQTTETLAALEQVMGRLDSVLASAEFRRTGTRVDTLSANLARLTNHLGTATASLDTLLGRMNRGEGTLGKIATDTALYRNLTDMLAALTALLNDLKERPGRYLTVKVF